MDVSRLTGLAGKMQQSTLSLLVWDEVVDAVMVEQSILGPSISVMERFPNGETVYETIAARVAATGKVPSRVTVCLPRSETVMRTLRYPALVQNDLEQMVPFEATRHLPFPETDRCLGYNFVQTEDHENLDVHLLAARSTSVNRVLTAVQAAGLPVDVALVFSSMTAGSLGTEPTVFVVSDVKHIEVSLVCNGLVCDSMCLPRNGGPPLIGAVQRIIASNHERIGPGGIARLVTAGPEPLGEGQKEELCVTLGLDAEALAAPEALSAPLKHYQGEVLVEALLAACSLPPPSLNLTAFAGRRVPMNRRTKWILGLTAVLLFELVAGWMLWMNAPARAQKSAEEKMLVLSRQAEPVQKMKDQNRAMRNELLALHDLVNNRASLMEMLQILSDKIPEDSYFTGLEYERGGRIKMEGRTKDPDALLALLMMDIPFVSMVEASDIGEKRGEYHSFSFTCSLKGADDE
jgi:hypothetical protein